MVLGVVGVLLAHSLVSSLQPRFGMKSVYPDSSFSLKALRSLSLLLKTAFIAVDVDMIM